MMPMDSSSFGHPGMPGNMPSAAYVGGWPYPVMQQHQPQHAGNGPPGMMGKGGGGDSGFGGGGRGKGAGRGARNRQGKGGSDSWRGAGGTGNPPQRPAMGAVPLPEAGGDTGAGGSSGSGQRSRPKRASKRATFPLINGKLVAAAQTGDVHILVQTIEANLPQMNLVNLATALHRLAKCTAGDTKSQALIRRHRVMSEMAAAVKQALERAEANNAPPQCQALSNIIWAMATFQAVDLGLLALVADMSSRNVSHFKSFELSSALWAFAKLGDLDGQVWAMAAPLFETACVQVHRNVREYSFRCLVMVAWACATARYQDEEMIYCLAEHVLPSLNVASCQELEQIAWAFSSAGLRYHAFFLELARKATARLGEFTPADLFSVLLSVARGGVLDEDFYERVLAVSQAGELEVASLAQLTYEISKIRPRTVSTQAFVARFLAVHLQRLPSLGPLEMATVALAAAGLFSGSGLGGIDVPADALQLAAEYFAAVKPQALPKLRHFSPEALAYLTTAFFSSADAGDAAFCDAIAAEVLRRGAQVQAFDGRCLLLLAHALLKAPQTANSPAGVAFLFGGINLRITSLNGKELQALSMLCNASLRLSRERLELEELRSCCGVLSSAAATTSIPAIEGLGDRFLDLLLLGPLQDGRLSGGRASAEHAGHGTAAGSAAAGPGGEQLFQPPLADWAAALSVKNTFIDFADRERATADAEMKLGPPLDIIPPSVSEEKLAAYRMDYQNFRAGNAVGAKGEVSESVGVDGQTDLGAALDLAMPSLAPLMPSMQGGAVGAAGMSPASLVTTPGLDPMAVPSPVYSALAANVPAPVPPHSEAMPADPGAAGAAAAWDCSVKNTFVHINDQCDSSSSDDEGPAKPLAPPLDFLPAVVSGEKLAAYRTDYQKFRSGKAMGARGEVSSTVALDLAGHTASGSGQGS
eukprot:TRINITY_DN38345_c0_g2_i1.p1 TRINITY_DN38345_c0_g2~~TRINITY_DN38345_c0_g2_i1.p1  ORF type:complete len:927 (+),score=223.10 TRINITY_DN38345_c0_g2_i1:124-2904(+)